MWPKGKIIFVVGPPRSGSSMTAALLHACGAWGRVNGQVKQSGFHLNVLDECLLTPGIERERYLLDLGTTRLPGVPCPTDGLYVSGLVKRFYGVLNSLGWTGGPAVVRSHLILPFIPQVASEFPNVAFVGVQREPLQIAESVRRTGWMPLRTDTALWVGYAERYNAEIERFFKLPYVAGYKVRPQWVTDGNTHEIESVSRLLGLSWGDDASRLAASVKRKEVRDGQNNE